MGSIFKVFTLSGINRGSGDRSSAIDLGGKTLVRLQTHGKRLEMVVNPEEAWLLKQGDEVAIDDVVEGFIVFENFSKGLKMNEDDLSDIFETDSEREIAKLMLLKGDLQLTIEQRRAFVKEKRDEIIDYLIKNAVNPRTKTPHPKLRIEKALDDAGIRIDRKEGAKEQAERIITQLTTTLPMIIEAATIEFVVSPKDTGPLYGYIKSCGNLLSENWGTDGTLTMVVKTPSGLVASILEQVSDKSKGRVRSTVIDRSN